MLKELEDFKLLGENCETFTRHMSFKETLTLIQATIDSIDKDAIINEKVNFNLTDFKDSSHSDDVCASLLRRGLYLVYENAPFKILELNSIQQEILEESTEDKH